MAHIPKMLINLPYLDDIFDGLIDWSVFNIRWNDSGNVEIGLLFVIGVAPEEMSCHFLPGENARCQDMSSWSLASYSIPTLL